MGTVSVDLRERSQGSFYSYQVEVR